MKFPSKFPINIFSKICGLLLITILVSCSQRPARVINHSNDFYSKGSVKREQSDRRSSSGGYEIRVRSGDTLYGISKQYRVTLRDIIKANDLSPPYILKPGTKLNVPAPAYHTVKSGETLYAISRDYNMNINNLIELNDLQPPYSLMVGQKIRIANSSAAVSTARSNRSKSKYRFSSVKKSVKKIIPSWGGSKDFSWPLSGQVISRFGPKKGGLYNDGVNIKAAKGSSVKASASGVVAYVGNELKGYGNLVIIKHSGGWITAYAHLDQSLVKRGEKVAKGAKIGTVGATGNVSSPQLYFGLRKGRDAVNPENYLK